MRILILSLAAVLVLAALIFLTGWLMPATREGRAETVIAAPPDRILAVIADVEAQPDWRAVGRVTRTAEGWEEVTPRGERIAFVAEEMTGTRIRLRFTSDAGYTGAWEAVLERVEGGTRIAVVERATVPSPIGRILSRLMFDPGAFATMYLADLKARGGVDGEETDGLAQAFRRGEACACGDAARRFRGREGGEHDADLLARRHRGLCGEDPARRDADDGPAAQRTGAQGGGERDVPGDDGHLPARGGRDRLRELEEGKALDEVVPFWRVVTPDSKVAKKLSCGPDHVAHLIALDGATPRRNELSRCRGMPFLCPWRHRERADVA